VTVRSRTEAGFLNVGGARLEWRRVTPPESQPTAPTLVLLHEGLGSVGMWKDFPDALAPATGCPLFLWSRHGFGASDPITLPRPLDYLEQETALVPQVLWQAGIGRCVLVGHSDGGTIALLAAGGPAAPQIVGIVTMAAHVFVEDVTIDGIRETKRAWDRGDLRRRLARWHGQNVEGAFRGWCDTWLDPGFRAWNIEAALPAVRAPVLAMQGADDEYGTPAQVDAIARGVSGPARPMLIPGAGHAPHIDATAAVIEAIRLFLAALPCAAPSGPMA
jgi:pimeloyl-ACP methyl ester carboxylesterase